MHRISRDELFHRIVGAIRFDRELRSRMSNALTYTLADKICDLTCTDSVMVIEADIPGFNMRVKGKFGVDEPWPEWARSSDLILEGLVARPKAEMPDNEPQR